MANFQTATYLGPAPGIEGDFCTSNPRANVLAGPGALVAGAQGLTMARFAWLQPGSLDGDLAPAIANSFGAGAPNGFVRRDIGAALITTYLAEQSMLIQPGQAVTLFSTGDFWVKNRGLVTAQWGNKVYANNADGSAAFAPAGSPPGASNFTAAVAASTGAFTGSISGNVLSITAVTSGVAVPGGTITGTGIPAGTKIVKQIGGAAGGIGTYQVNVPNLTVASTAIAETYGTMTVSAVGNGTISVGQAVTGTNVVVPTYVTALGTGTGGTGTYIVDNNTVVASTAIAGANWTETRWYACSSGLVGDIVKMSHIQP